MKKLCLFSLMLLLIFLTVSFSFVEAAETLNNQEVNWKIFGKNIEKALLSNNDGLQRAGMQMLIRYGEKLNVGQGMIEILRTYRNDKADLQTRRLALAALPKTGSNLVMGYLKRAVEFEKSPVLKKQIQFIIASDAK